MSRFPLLAGMAAALLAVHIPFALAQISPQVGTGAETEMFQAVLHAAPDGTTALYLADSNTNAPIGGADIQAQAGEWQGAGQPTPQPGVYRLDWQPLAPTDVTLVIGAQGRDDLLLIGGFGPAQPGLAAAPPALSRAWAWALIPVLGLSAALLWRRRRRFAVLAVLALLLPDDPALAHSGHDHGGGDQPALSAVAGQIVTVVKASQFLVGVLTEPATARMAADAVRVPGRVIPDPAAYARVQPSQPARVVGDPAFPLPVPGQRVKRGQVLVVLEPTLSSLERSGQRGALYRVESDIALQERELARQESLGGVVTVKALETTRIRLDQLRRERVQIAGTALGRELVTAPVDGIIADLHVTPGEVVDPTKVMVEIVDTDHVRIEAVIHDPKIAARIGAASATTPLLPGSAHGLTLLGVSPRMDPVDQGIHAIFAPQPGHPPGLRIGMPVDVHLEAGTTSLAVAVPRQAVVDHGGISVVLVRVAPESFEIRPVRIIRVVGALAELEGIRPGDKVVVQGMDQVRGAR
ncbi:MAG: hypothetical protein FD176_3502 [Rhodospirillaceae bacterium]|nr:MAG: hypothetical protein FD176_3502 [Rhodospirillaceae bacterium]TNC96207.1 MAG: Uncharacterized protein FD119_1807 [Stygiobacter sp.]